MARAKRMTIISTAPRMAPSVPQKPTWMMSRTRRANKTNFSIGGLRNLTATPPM
jgi:hypothetical protein